MLLLEASPCLQPVTGGPLSGQAGVPIPCSLTPPPLHLEAFPSARGSGQKASALLMFSSPRTWRQALHGDLGLTDSSPCRPGAPLHAGPGRWHWLLASAVETLLSASQQSVSSRSFSVSFNTGDGQPPGDPGDQDIELAGHTVFPPGPSELPALLERDRPNSQ